MIHDEMDADVTMAGGAESTLLANRYRIVRQLGAGGMGRCGLPRTPNSMTARWR